MLVARYKFKKDLKASIGMPLQYTETSMFGEEYSSYGKFTVVGPGAYDRKWYAEVWIKDNLINKVT